MHVAVIGGGIAGLSCAWLLSRAGVGTTLFEERETAGGHTNTVDVTLDGVTAPVDTGFLVFNDWTYPNLIALFQELGVESAPSEMGFSVKLLDDMGRGQLEWSGARPFAQRSNMVRLEFWNMLLDLMRFNRMTTELCTRGDPMMVTLGEFLDEHRFSDEFRDWYLKPMAACIWSTPTKKLDGFPLFTLVHFCKNHGMLTINDQPQWRTVVGGGRTYVRKMLASLPDVRLGARITGVTREGQGATVTSERGTERFDHVVFACHTGQALGLLKDAHDDERDVLDTIPYQPNTAVLHTDASLLPRRRRAWSAWNYTAWHPSSSRGRLGAESPVSLNYLINRLQPIPFKESVIVTLNPVVKPDPTKILRTIEYEHPIFAHGSVEARRKVRGLQGRRRTWFAGAWTRWGFHEDGLMSGISVATALGAKVPWQTNVPAANDLTARYPGVDA